MIREICRDETFLAQKAAPATADDLATAQDLLDTLTAHKDGCVGMAANMIGICKRIIVFDNEGNYMVMFNPEIIKTSGEQDGAEGCLSFPGEFGMVKRPMNVTVRAQDRNGKTFEISGTELLARAFCHEIDHLNGICFVTRASRMLEPDELES